MTPQEHMLWVRFHGWMTLFWGADPDGVTAGKLAKRFNVPLHEAEVMVHALVTYWQTFHKVLYTREHQ